MFVGIDPSLAGTAMAFTDPSGVVRLRRWPTDPAPGYRATLTRKRRIERAVRDQLRALLDVGSVDGVAIEGPAYGVHTGSSHERDGIWWALYDRLQAATRLDPMVISPKTVKKYATGSGNADKDAVWLAARRTWPGLKIGSNDEADALQIMAICARWHGHPVEAGYKPAEHLKAMQAIHHDTEARR